MACASAPPPLDLDARDWHEVRSERFRVIGNVEAEELADFTRDLLRFHALIRRVTNARVEAPDRPLTLYLVAERKQARALLGLASGMLVPALPGYFAVVDAGPSTVSTREILFHEYVHYVLRSGRRVPYPRWYDEGFSEFLSTARFRDDAVIVGAPPGNRLAFLSAKGLMPLDQLFSPTLFRTYEKVLSHYASSWAVVHHLNSRQDGRGRLQAFVARLGRGEPWREAFDSTFEQDLEELETAVNSHVALIQRGVRVDFHMPLDRLEVDPILSEGPVAPAEVAFGLGEVARWIAEENADPDWDEVVRPFFERALQLDPEHVPARAALAVALARGGRLEKARVELRRVLREAAPDDPAVALARGRVLAFSSSGEDAASSGHQAAREALEHAVALAPAQPETHAALGGFHARREAPALAVAALVRARELGAWSPRLDLELASQLLVLGRRDEAVRLLAPLASDSHRGEISEQARELSKDLAPETSAD